MLLFGDAGAGKTMNLCRLFYEAAQPILSYRAKSPLPDVRVVARAAPRTNRRFPSEDLDRELPFKDLEEGRFLFLMDSVDGLSSASAKRLSGALNEFMRRYPLNRYIVTARRPLPVSLELPNWVELLPSRRVGSDGFSHRRRGYESRIGEALVPSSQPDLSILIVGNPNVLSVARRFGEKARVFPRHSVVCIWPFTRWWAHLFRRSSGEICCRSWLCI